MPEVFFGGLESQNEKYEKHQSSRTGDSGCFGVFFAVPSGKRCKDEKIERIIMQVRSGFCGHPVLSRETAEMF